LDDLNLNAIEVYCLNNCQRIDAMNPLSRYIDLMLVDEYATKDIQAGYSLYLDELPESERTNFLAQLLKSDPILQERIEERMQTLIDERLKHAQSKDMDDEGLTIIYQKNGDSYVGHSL
jgi:hypothetical protein